MFTDTAIYLVVREIWTCVTGLWNGSGSLACVSPKIKSGTLFNAD